MTECGMLLGNPYRRGELISLRQRTVGRPAAFTASWPALAASSCPGAECARLHGACPAAGTPRWRPAECCPAHRPRAGASGGQARWAIRSQGSTCASRMQTAATRARVGLKRCMGRGSAACGSVWLEMQGLWSPVGLARARWRLSGQGQGAHKQRALVLRPRAATSSAHPAGPAAAGPGELRVRGPQLFREYWRRPEATAEAFDERGFFLTGERAGRRAVVDSWHGR